MKTNKILPIQITEEALAEIKNILQFKNIPSEYGLRIGIKGAGCAGVSYVIGFDTKKVNDDDFNVDGICIYIEKKHTMYLIGLLVDFKDEAEERGFVFLNPDHKSK